MGKRSLLRHSMDFLLDFGRLSDDSRTELFDLGSRGKGILVDFLVY